jgi:hypothetical protein
MDYLRSFEFTSMLALYVYWVPLTVCLVVYFFRTIARYKLDLKRCEEKHYSPELTIGRIVWYVVLTITPSVNLFALVFDCASSVFKWLGRVFDVPLVPKRPAAE